MHVCKANRQNCISKFCNFFLCRMICGGGGGGVCVGGGGRAIDVRFISFVLVFVETEMTNQC